MDGYNYWRDSGKRAFIMFVHGGIKDNLREYLESAELENLTMNEQEFSFTAIPEDKNQLLIDVAGLKNPPNTIYKTFEL